MLDILKSWLAVQREYDAAIAAKESAIKNAESLQQSLEKLRVDIGNGDFGVNRFSTERFIDIEGCVVRLNFEGSRTKVSLVKVETLDEPKPVPADVEQTP